MRQWAYATLCAFVASALLLGGCKREAPSPSAINRSMPMVAAVAPNGIGQHFAYSHSFAVQLPGDMVQAAQQRNLAECVAAGCIVLATHIDQMRDGVVRASISIRIGPERFAAFASAVTAAPAMLSSHTETAEDKTVPLLDIEKRLEAQIALRGRLGQMLQQAGTGVADLVAVEKQLAEVQGTIESETAQRDYLHAITATVKVDVAYNGVTQQASPFDASPIRIALNEFGRTAIQSFGDMITLVAAMLPWVVLAALAGWLARRLWAKRLP